MMRKSFPQLITDEPPPPKRGRSSEDFLMFCKMILDYENYDDTSSEQLRLRHRHTSSPMGSIGSLGSGDSSSYSEERRPDTSDEDTITDDFEEGEDEEITCYCRKPYGGRPMIECSSCQTWVHLTCAKVKRSAIPDVWFCAQCKTKSTNPSANKSRARKSLQGRRKLSSSSLSPPQSGHVRSSSKRKL